MSLLTIAKDETMPGAEWIFVVLTGSLAECTDSGECTQVAGSTSCEPETLPNGRIRCRSFLREASLGTLLFPLPTTCR